MAKRRQVLTLKGIVETSDDRPEVSPAKVSHVEQGEMLFRREKRPKKAKASAPMTDRLVDEALQAWADYLRVFFLPKASFELDKVLGTVYELPATVRVQQSGHSDPTLAAILADEREQWAWPKTIHALIFEMDAPHRIVLLGVALQMPQHEIADYLKCEQPWVSKLLVRAKRSLLIVLAMLEHVRAAHEKRQREIDRCEGVVAKWNKSR